ncbi:hypothetical protein SteCoe_1692 [Stentor coeruleus]|uniref:Uncharacterized protein n=1 Tax=Stentor coeruleus TaxID=5963 RepID=A0A1R2D158_9CILI|nr:hypothetical protein SteCoe_1692 [Stentor coeruleus]
MDWLNEKAPKEKTKILFMNKTLTMSGVSSLNKVAEIKQESKFENTNNDDDLYNFGYSQGEKKKILEYFSLVQEVEKYCRDVFQVHRERFLMFSRHPLFNKFFKKTKDKFDSTWKYNLEIMGNDKKFLQEMRNLLRNVVENPSETFEFETIPVEIVNDWKKGMKKVLSLVRGQSQSHKAQVKSHYLKAYNS